MADRIVNASDTFETFRTTFNSTATDIGEIASITGASGVIASATDIVEAVVALNTSLSSGQDLADSTGSGQSATNRLKLGTHDDLHIYHDNVNSYVEHLSTGTDTNSTTGNLVLKNKGVEVTIPATSGVISTEGFSIALATALGG